MNNLIWVALLLIIIWVIATVTRVVIGAMLHVLWVLALVLLVIWVIRKFF